MQVHVQRFVIAALGSILLAGSYAGGQSSPQPIIITGGQHGISLALRDLAPGTYVQTSTAPAAPTTGLNFDGIAAGLRTAGTTPT